MQSKILQTMAVIGISALVEASDDASPESEITVHYHESDPEIIPGHIFESSLTPELSKSGHYFYDQFDRDGQALAYTLVQQECKGKNNCRGMNSCKLEGINHCAGLAQCKGKGNGYFEDKNLAIKVAAKLMAERRLELIASQN